MQVKFDDATIRNLEPAKQTDYVCMAKGEPGFGIRVLQTGTMTFFYQYKVDGQRRTMTLCNYVTASKKGGEKSLKDARELYHSELVKVKALRRWSSDAVDPVAEKKRQQVKRIAEEAARSQADTVAELCKEYIERHAMKFKRSWKEDERILNKEIVPAWGKRKAADIVKRDVLRALESIIDRGSPGQANNSFQVIRKMFNFAVERDILPFSPCNGLKLPAPKKTRDRVFTEQEIKAFWNNLLTCAMSNELRFALKLILITAQRPGEVIGMHTNEINGNWWTISADRAKNGKTHRVPLSGLAVEIIQQAIEHVRTIREIPTDVEYSGYIFPCPHLKKTESITRHALAVAVGRNLEWPVIDDKGKPVIGTDGNQTMNNRFSIDHFTPHDLRRTAATFMAQSGEMDEVIDAVLNHAKQGVIKVYNQYRYDKEKQMALEKWERKLLSIVTESQKKDNVVNIHVGKRKAA
jgi:integrase